MTSTSAPSGVDATLDPASFLSSLHMIEAELGKVIVGQKALVRDTVVALLAGGHVLFEGVPGLGKTVLVKTLGDVLGFDFSRIQFTPDLMPADIVGTAVIEESDGAKRFRFEAGPVFAHLVLADEINRATPKTQSALLEAMQERTVTAAGETRPLPAPFFVFATQNPIDMEGTYPLPEAQLDRFLFKLTVPFPSADELAEIARRTTGVDKPDVGIVAGRDDILGMISLARSVPVADHVLDYAVRLVTSTHPDRSEVADVTRHVRFGASPRGLQALLSSAKVRALADGRFAVSFADVSAGVGPSLGHRLILRFGAEAAGHSAESILSQVVEQVVPDPLVAR